MLDRDWAVKRRRPYARWYRVREWGWYISYEGFHEPVVQVNLGRLGITLPIEFGPNRKPPGG